MALMPMPPIMSFISKLQPRNRFTIRSVAMSGFSRFEIQASLVAIPQGHLLYSISGRPCNPSPPRSRSDVDRVSAERDGFDDVRAAPDAA